MVNIMLIKNLNEGWLTSFLSMGVRKGSLTLRPATIVNTGSRQLKRTPNTSIFPSFGSIGNIVRYRPAKEEYYASHKGDIATSRTQEVLGSPRFPSQRTPRNLCTHLKQSDFHFHPGPQWPSSNPQHFAPIWNTSIYLMKTSSKQKHNMSSRSLQYY